MRPRLFIGSSTESLKIAYAAQENLERVAEVTVWDQGVFELSKYTLDSLVETMDVTDFGLFVFAPDDVVKMRGHEMAVARDNIVFEFGLFVGRLGKDRTFIILPRGAEAGVHLPTDLLGITPALYDADRTDGNLRAALGPACSKVARVLEKFQPPPAKKSVEDPKNSSAQYDDADIKAILGNWMYTTPYDNVIHFADVDSQLNLPPGSAKKFLKEAAAQYKLVPVHEGLQTIKFSPK